MSPCWLRQRRQQRALGQQREREREQVPRLEQMVWPVQVLRLEQVPVRALERVLEQPQVPLQQER